ncbi:MAG: DNA polymerase/3'-5' exonuclease PolX [Nitrospirota bacterium]
MEIKNTQIANIFNRMADILEFKGENSFKINAYRNAARVIQNLTEDIEILANEGKLREIPGVGEGIAKKIDEYIKTGRMTRYEEVKTEIPESLIDLSGIQGLGPKTLMLIYRELGIKNLLDLQRAIENGSLAKLPQMGEKKVENIKQGVKLFQASRERILLGFALPEVWGLIEELQKFPEVTKISPAGSLRRSKETVGDIDILITGGNKTIDYFVHLPQVKSILSAGETKGSIITEDGMQVDVRVVEEDSFGAALQYFTGSKAHNIKLREMAKKKGLKLNEYGVFKGEEKIAGKSEEDVYAALNLPWIPPEIREDSGEIEAAINHNLPKLVQPDDIQGDLHVHTNWSDGSSSIEEMALYAKSLGYKYIAICDHSQSVKYAGGLTEDELLRQIEDIAELNGKLSGIRILAGSEVDIKQDGTLDYPDWILEKLDIVVVAVHIGFKHNVTERICRAMEHPLVDIIAHPTGRLISSREGYIIDLEKILEKASQTKTVLEINSYYERLDLNDINCKRASELGCRFAIDTDSHHLQHLWMMKLGVGVARRAWLSKDLIINTQPLHNLLLKRSIRNE